MKKAIFILFLGMYISSFAQVEQQFSFGYGLNNCFDNNNFPGVGVSETKFIGSLDYHYIFKNKFEARLNLNYADFTLASKKDTGITFFNTPGYGLNFGGMYHFYRNKRLDFSSGFSLGVKYQEVQSKISVGEVNDVSFVSSINLINIKYFPFDEHFGIYGEIVLGLGYQANYFVGLVYQL